MAGQSGQMATGDISGRVSLLTGPVAGAGHHIGSLAPTGTAGQVIKQLSNFQVGPVYLLSHISSLICVLKIITADCARIMGHLVCKWSTMYIGTVTDSYDGFIVHSCKFPIL